MLKLLAFDYGASSGRGMLGKFDGNKIHLEEVHRFANEPVFVGSSLHWDVLRLYHEMKQGIIKCAASGDKDIASIGIDTWGVDFGLLDSEGRLLGNPFHYRDDNTRGMIEEAFKIVPKREIYEETGLQFMVFNTLFQLLSMKVNNYPLLEKASTMLFMPDLLKYFLTGEKSSEYTITSTSQLQNPRTGEWTMNLMKKMGIPTDLLADIVDPGTISGKLTKRVSDELGVGSIPVVSVAEHDTASAVVSVPVTSGKYAYLSSGTWSLLGVESADPVINDATYRLNYTNEGGFNRTVRLLKNIMGLWIYQECRRTWNQMGESTDYAELQTGAEKTEAFKSLINPDDDTFYSPGNMPQKIQDYCKKTGQKIPETKYEIVRCIMESLALKYRMAVEGLEEIVGYKIPVLHVVGGGCQNTMLSQYTANAINRPVITGPIEATATGNIIAQLIALGEVKDLTQGRTLVKNSFPTIDYLPKDIEAWNDAYGRFEKLSNVF